MTPKLSAYDASISDLINDLRNFFDVYGHIDKLTLLGGEPFLRKDIASVVQAVSEYQLIMYDTLLIVTSATVLPDRHTLQVLASKDVLVHVDDYGTKSSKFNSLTDGLDYYNVKYVVHHYNEKEQYCDGWIRLGPFENKHYDSERIKNVFELCHKKTCPILWKHRLYVCSTAASLVELNIAPDNQRDFVDIRNKITKADIDGLFCNIPQGCRYCNGFNLQSNTRVTAAIQIGEEEI
jgi:organic radical activating enzyme